MWHKRLSAILLASVFASPAFAGSGSITVLDSASATHTYEVITQAGGNFVGMFGLCDGTAAAQCVAVKAASTAAVATDPAVVVAISPNNTVGVTGTFWQTTQPVSLAALPALVAGSATIGKVDVLGNAGAIMDFAGQNASSPANALLIGGQFQTTPTTITPGNSSPFQLDNAGNLLVNVKAGGGAGGTSAADAATWTAGTTAQTAIGCEYTSGGATALVTAHMGTVGCTTARGVFTDKSSVGGTALSAAVSAYGTAPTGTEVEGVNAFVTNTNANGSAVSASSSPVVIASDQAAVATKAASSAFVAGSIADLAHGQGTMSASVPVAIASNQSVADPCMFQAKTNVTISTASGTAALVTGVSGKKIYVCSLVLVAPSAVSVSLAEGSGTTCGTSNQAGVIGVATNGTAANGLAFAANGGLTLGNGGGTIASTATAADYLCLFQSGTAQMAGNLTYVQQ